MRQSQKRRPVLRFLFRGLALLFALLLILAGVVYYLAVSGQERAPALVEEAFREQFGATATFGRYHFEYFSHFPFLSMTLEDISLRDSLYDSHGRELLFIKRARLQFRPWKLLRRQFVARSLEVDSARIRLYRSADGYFNASFLNAGALPARSDSAGALFSLDKIKANSLSFEWQDALTGKHHRLELGPARLHARRRGGRVSLRLRGDCYFTGLVFKAENGPYLRRQGARLDLKAELGRQEGLFRLLPSTMAVGDDQFALEGHILRGAPPRIHLEISSEGLLLDDARPLLADNLRKALQPYSASHPLSLALLIDGPLEPGQQTIQLDFSCSSTSLAAGGIRFAGARLSGRYRNRCGNSGPITPHSDCLDVELASALFQGSIPMQLSYHAADMKSPAFRVEGQARARLEQLNTFLPAEQFRFLGGAARARFAAEGKGSPAALLPGFRLGGTMAIREGVLEYVPGGVALREMEASLRFHDEGLHVEFARMSLKYEPIELQGWVFGLTPSAPGRASELRVELDVDARRLVFDDFLPIPGRAASRPGATRALRIGLNVRADEVRYRKLQAGDARFRLEAGGPEGSGLRIDSLSALIFGGIPIQASLRLSQPDDPKLEMKLQAATSLERFNPLLPPALLRLGGGQFFLAMRYEGRLDDYFNLSEEALRGRLEGHARLRGASAEYLPRAYSIQGLDGSFRFDGQGLAIDSMRLSVNGNAIRAQGQAEGFIPFLFRPGRRLKVSLQATTAHLDLNRFPLKTGKEKPPRGTFPPNRLAKALDAMLARIEGELAVYADTLHFRKADFTEAAFTCRLFARCKGMQHDGGCAAIDNFSGKLFGNTPIRASLSVHGLDDPFFIADAQAEAPMKELNRMFPPERFAFHKGVIDVVFHYEGQPHDQFDVENALLKAKISGKAQITDGALDFKPRGYRLENMQAVLSFGESGLSVQKLELLLNGNVLHARGQLYDFLPFLFLPERELRASLDLYSPHFDFGRFMAPQKFVSKAKKGPYEPTPITELVLAGLDHIDAELGVRLDTVSYRHFKAAKMAGQLRLTPRLLRIEDAGMALADGQFRLEGQITGLEENKPDIDVQAKFLGADIQKAFRAFGNFGQQEMRAENIEGTLTAEAAFKARANANYDILPGSMEGRIHLKVEDGALIGLPALDSIQSFLLRKRSLENIRFATLENTFRLKGQDIFFDHFFVASTALTFGVQGRYGFGEAGRTNLLFELPVGNLFRPGLRVEALQDLGDHGKGPALLLRARKDEEGKLNFRLVWSRKERE